MEAHGGWLQRVMEGGCRGSQRVIAEGHRGLWRACLHLVDPSNHILSG